MKLVLKGVQSASDALKAVCQQKLAAAKMPPEVVALSEAAGRFYETSVYFRQPPWTSLSASSMNCQPDLRSLLDAMYGIR